MRALDFLILIFCCLAWAVNFVVAAWALSENPIPPFLLAAVRAVVVLVIMGRFLIGPLPPKFFRLLFVCACVGAIHLGFLYTGLQTADVSASSIVSQLLIPFATILSMIFLKERVGWVRGVAISGAFFGTMVMIYNPDAVQFEFGLVYIVLAYVVVAVGTVVMKTLDDVDWKQYVAWTAVVMSVSMGIASFVFESDHAQMWQTSKWPLLIAAGYAGVFVSIVAHGQYFRLIQSYTVTRIVPVTLLVPLFASILAVMFLGESLSSRVIVGASIILPCVFIIAKMQGGTAHEEG